MDNLLLSFLLDLGRLVLRLESRLLLNHLFLDALLECVGEVDVQHLETLQLNGQPLQLVLKPLANRRDHLGSVVHELLSLPLANDVLERVCESRFKQDPGVVSPILGVKLDDSAALRCVDYGDHERGFLHVLGEGLGLKVEAHVSDRILHHFATNGVDAIEPRAEHGIVRTSKLGLEPRLVGIHL